MLQQASFFEKYRIDKKAFDASGLRWEELQEIHQDYLEFHKSLEPHASLIAAILRNEVSQVHSIKLRIKNPEHLIEKIIRHTLTTVNRANYRDLITDLIGLRALHLFKDDWADIHRYIVDRWELRTTPTANIQRETQKSVLRSSWQRSAK